MNKKETAQILAIVQAAYPYNPNRANPESTVEAWMMILGDYDAQTVLRAAQFHMKTCKYFPTPADIVQKIGRAELLYTSSGIGIEGKTKMIAEANGTTEEWTLEKTKKLFEFLGYEVN